MTGQNIKMKSRRQAVSGGKRNVTMVNQSADTIFTSMGVSEVDVQTYVNSLSGYIYAILGTFVLMIAVMIAAHFLVKKGNPARGEMERRRGVGCSSWRCLPT